MTAMNPLLARASFVLVAVCGVLCGTTAAFVPTTFRGTAQPHYSTQLAAAASDREVDCLVIGGGISGSSLAHNLNRAGVSMLLTEARDYLGGNVKSQKKDGFIWEEGPNSYATQPSIVRIAYELGIADQLVFADEELPPWVFHNGKLHPLPKGGKAKGAAGQLELVFGKNGVMKFALVGDLLSWPGRIRAGIGAFVGHAKAPEGKDETIREWITRILGEEVFLRCIDPFVSGVYAGNPETLSMRAALSKIARIEDIAYSLDWNKFGAIFYGGLARQVELAKERKADPPAPEWPEFEYGNPGSFKEGLGTLPNAIAKELGDKVELQWKVTKIEKTDNGSYKATFETPNGVQTVTAKSIVSTVPAHSLANVLEPVMPESKSIFEKVRTEIDRIGIYHPPVAAVTVAYPKSSFKDIELDNGFGNLQDLPGFGSLNPRTEGVRTLGTLWTSSLFPGRCPPDYNLLLNYIGGSRDIGIADLTEEEIVAEVDKGCRTVLLNPDAPAPKVLGVKLWPTAIPQYEIGHLPLVKELVAAESKLPGLYISGNYRTGVAFPDCVTFGYDQAKVVKAYLDGCPAVESKEEIAVSI
jgi:oxygen-dependent protoporphyrinogen oxidase